MTLLVPPPGNNCYDSCGEQPPGRPSDSILVAFTPSMVFSHPWVALTDQ